MILRTNVITKKGVLFVGVVRGLAFYVSGTPVDVDLYALREDEFNDRYPAEAPSQTAWAIASLRSPEGGQVVTAKAGAVLRWAEQVVRRADWNGTLTAKDLRTRPKLSHGRRPKNLRKDPLLSGEDEVYFSQANATAADNQTAEPLRENIMSKIAVSKGAAAPKTSATTKPAAKGATAPKTDAKGAAAEAKNVPAKPKGLSTKSAATSTPKDEAAPKTDAKASKVPKTEAPKTEGAARGRKRDEAVFQTKVIATDKSAREGSFYGIVKAEASKPIVLEDLIGRVLAKVGDSLRSEKDATVVVRARVRDCFSRLGFLTEA